MYENLSALLTIASKKYKLILYVLYKYNSFTMTKIHQLEQTKHQLCVTESADRLRKRECFEKVPTTPSHSKTVDCIFKIVQTKL